MILLHLNDIPQLLSCLKVHILAVCFTGFFKKKVSRIENTIWIILLFCLLKQFSGVDSVFFYPYSFKITNSEISDTVYITQFSGFFIKFKGQLIVFRFYNLIIRMFQIKTCKIIHSSRILQISCFNVIILGKL